MPLSATAAGKVSDGTCSLTEDCQAGPISAMPVPTMKQNASRMLGVTRLSHARTVSAVAPTSEIASDTIATTRRSCMSAMAPAGAGAGRHRDQHDRQHQRGLDQRDLVGRRCHLRHRPGGADALDQEAEI